MFSVELTHGGGGGAAGVLQMLVDHGRAGRTLYIVLPKLEFLQLAMSREAAPWLQLILQLQSRQLADSSEHRIGFNLPWHAP